MEARQAIAWVVLAAGCGRVGFGAARGAGDGGADGPVAGARDAPDDAPVDAPLDAPVDAPAGCAWASDGPLPANQQSPAEDWEPALRPGGALLVFASSRTGTPRLYASARVGPGWSTPAELPVGGSFAAGPAWSAAGDRLYFVTDATSYGLHSATFDGTSFGPAVREPDAGWSGGIEAPWVSEDGLRLYFTRATNDRGLWLAVRAAAGQPWVVQGAVPGLPPPGGAGRVDGWPTLTSDELTIYFESTRADLAGDVYVARRASPGDAFGAPSPVPALAAPGVAEGDPDVSPDGRSLMLASDGPGSVGGSDLAAATLRCP